MRPPRLATLVGGLLLSRRARGFAGRHAGMLALWQRRQTSGAAPRPRAKAEAKAGAKPHARTRWSGRRR